MTMLSLIEKRRDGLKHTQEEIAFLVRGAASGEIPDYQLSAWLMAAVLRPLGPQETAWLTLAMAHSGQTLDLSSLPKPWLDKHSTGGVGDKTSIVLLPLLAACGLTVVKMSGRGLGITGGTVDKLESVPGFRMDLTPEELIGQAKRIGLAITGPTAELAPADKVLYALRDATATVASVPLIVSSILSKKLAGGAETVILDVKCGRGSFMPDFDAAENLALALKETAELCGLRLRVAITDMSQPLGRTVGNALEVSEAVEVLNGDSQTRFARLCLALAGMALHAAGRTASDHEGELQAEEALRRGLARTKAEQWFEAQGASPAVLDLGGSLPRAPVVREVRSTEPSGWVAGVDARAVGLAALELGAGRRTKSDKVNPAVGIEVLTSVGLPITTNQVAFRIHAATVDAAQKVEQSLAKAVQVLPEPVATPATILATY